MNVNELIYDRDQADLSNNTRRAYHNVSDLQRINEACEYLGSVFGKAGITNTMILKSDWGAFDYSRENIENMLDNIRALRGFLEMPQFAMNVPVDFERPTLEKANDIERVLYEIYMLGNFFLTADGETFHTADEEIFLLGI